MNVIPELDIKRDIPIILNSVNYEDTYNGEFTQRRAVIYTLNFTAKTYLYGPMSNQGIIKEVQADLGADTDPKLSREERIVIKTNPTSADADDDFGFTTTITSFSDSKRYNPWVIQMSKLEDNVNEILGIDKDSQQELELLTFKNQHLYLER